MNSLKISELKDGQRFSSSLMLDKQFVVLDSAVPFSESLRKALEEWNFATVETEGEIQVEKPKPKVIPKVDFETVDLDLDSFMELKPAKLNDNVQKLFATIENELKISPDTNRIEYSNRVYNEFMEYTKKIYTRFVTHRELNIDELYESLKKLISFVDENKKYILRINPPATQVTDKNFIISHSFRSTIFSIVIGLQLKMPSQKLVELATATLLHEIGQIRLPPQLYLTDKALSSAARALLSTHPVLGFNILKDKKFPLSIQLGVLEHHERENGRGYPRHLEGDKITIYGKVISIACTYEAISAPRQYREAKSGHEAIIEMLRNSEKQYDETIIKAFVQAISLFPIGSYVYLSNGKIAQVVDTNPNDQRTPLVQILGEKNELGNPKIVMTDNDRLKIQRILNRDELKDVLKFVG